jgi:hypothetical protein
MNKIVVGWLILLTLWAVGSETWRWLEWRKDAPYERVECWRRHGFSTPESRRSSEYGPDYSYERCMARWEPWWGEEDE